jgi:hypothetical protein
MLCCTRKEWVRASVWFALACMFRSNGIFLSGYIVWGLVVQPILQGHWVWPLSFISLLMADGFPPARISSSPQNNCSNSDRGSTFRWIPGLCILHILRRRQERPCGHMVLKLPPVHLCLHAIKVLGCWLPAVLDAQPGAQLYYRRPDSGTHFHIRVAPSSTCACGRSNRNPERCEDEAAHSASLQLPERVHHTLCNSCFGFCLHYSFHVAYTDHPPPCGLVTFCALGGGVADDGTSFLGTCLGFLERSLGHYLTSFVGYISSTGLNFKLKLDLALKTPSNCCSNKNVHSTVRINIVCNKKSTCAMS